MEMKSVNAWSDGEAVWLFVSPARGSEWFCGPVVVTCPAVTNPATPPPRALFKQRVRAFPVTKIDRTSTDAIVSMRRTIPTGQSEFPNYFFSDQKKPVRQQLVCMEEGLGKSMGLARWVLFGLEGE
ncbi:hypothetical protein RHGRI_035626 [Rhododendron griersonianum]|uniref:Uncharacterized protein n=1 Tax=Rhododendron griersonianum TaxID=479676 RepID=A0AAV6HQF7_9ERIC|nr:hypothetical protein RHGRI_035626 [Rhododendron griersonianum]